MALKVIWTENAVQDLILIKDFISQDSVARANEWATHLFATSENLSSLPLRGRIVPEFNQENIRELLIENYRLVYRIKKSSIEILTVFEGHRLLHKTNLKK